MSLSYYLRGMLGRTLHTQEYPALLGQCMCTMWVAGTYNCWWCGLFAWLRGCVADVAHLDGWAPDAWAACGLSNVSRLHALILCGSSAKTFTAQGLCGCDCCGWQASFWPNTCAYGLQQGAHVWYRCRS